MTNTRDELYKSGTAPWVIGRPQAAIVELLEAGQLRGRVLDLGCGTAEHALLCAERGCEAWGIDLAPTAIDQAKELAAKRGLVADLRVHDALDLVSLGTTFDTVMDVGFFHTLDDASRPRYAAQLARILNPGGTLHLLCFSDREPPWGGPRRITERELAETFETAELHVASVTAKRFERSTSAGDAASAWLAGIRKR